MTTRILLRAVVLAALIPFGFLSCATQSVRTFSSPDTYRHLETDTSIRVESTDENINGTLPAEIFIKTRTQTFNSTRSFIIVSGRIYWKPVDTADANGWKLFMGTGLPHGLTFRSPSAVVEISADSDELVALADNGLYYYILLESAFGVQPMRWFDKHGWPDKTTLAANDLVRDNRAWALAKRKDQVLWYEDRFGNQHHYGVIGLETYYYLENDGQGIRFSDNGLPADFSHDIMGPERGAFIAKSLSASASTIFVINDAGEMYTRLADFDTLGSDPMLFHYTYKKTVSGIPGSDMGSTFTPWGLPSEDWKKQPNITLTGKAKLTSRITILQTGQGNDARELRVAGHDANGDTGYFYKTLTESEWNFRRAPLMLRNGDFLETDSPNAGRRGAPLESALYGTLMQNGVAAPDVRLFIPDFPIGEGSCHLVASRLDEAITIDLHPVEAWTYFPRYNPGRDGTPKLFFMTVALPESGLANLSPEFARIITNWFAAHDREAFASVAEATTDYLYWRFPGNDPSIELFFTTNSEGTGDMNPAIVRQISFLRNSLVERCADHSLVIDDTDRIDITRRAEITAKLLKNEMLRDAIKKELFTINNYRTSTNLSRWSFSALDTLSSITLIRTFNPVSISDLLDNGDRLMKMNQETYRHIFEARRTFYDMNLEILDLRIDSYRGLLRDFDSGKLRASLPPLYGENFALCYGNAKMPLVIEGMLRLPSGETEATCSLAAADFPLFVLKPDASNQGVYLVALEDSAREIVRHKDPVSRESPLRFAAKLRALSSPQGSASESTQWIAANAVWDGTKFTLYSDLAYGERKVLFAGN
jgi:hypothetical protein